MIDLAPNHKLGLTVANPVLLAGGTIGYGEAVSKGLTLSRLGAVVVGPIVQSSRMGSAPPRLAHTNGGFVLETGLQNRGIGAVLKHFARWWPRLGCPVIAQLADTQPGALAKVVGQLTSNEGLSGLELRLPRHADADLTRKLVRAITHNSDLPVWVKLPLESAVELAVVAVEAEAVGLVVGQPISGVAHAVDIQAGIRVTGALFGPLTFAPMLAVLIEVAKLDLPVALLACGGVHTIEHAHQALAAGAHAVQIDSAFWVEPGLPERIVAALS